MSNSNLIFENYENYISENSADIGDPRGVSNILRDDNVFADLKDNLLEGIDDSTRTVLHRVLDRQRDSLLEEASSNVGSSIFTHGWTVMSFPILVDIYQEPIISQVMNVYPVSSPTLSIPRVKIKANVIGYDGSVSGSYTIPTPHSLIRPGFVSADVPSGISNLFTLSGIDSQGVIMNRRYTIIEGVQIRVTDGSSLDEIIEVPCSFRPDSRDNISGDSAIVQFTGPSGSADEAIMSQVQLSINLNYDDGKITNQATLIIDPTATLTYEYVGCKSSLKFTAKNSDKGRTHVNIENSMTDITIDPNEDFLISTTTEELQDYRSIFKIDLARTLSEAIKRQILLNKDFDLAYYLKASESEIAQQGAMFNVDISKYNFSASAVAGYSPNNVYDVMKGIIPYISSAISTVYKNFRMYP